MQFFFTIWYWNGTIYLTSHKATFADSTIVLTEVNMLCHIHKQSSFYNAGYGNDCAIDLSPIGRNRSINIKVPIENEISIIGNAWTGFCHGHTKV